MKNPLKGRPLTSCPFSAGAHTLGVGHCQSFQNRLKATASDPTLGLLFGAQLRATCLADEEAISSTDLQAFFPNDLTNTLFDSMYFQGTVNGRGLFTIDAELPLDSRTADIEQTFAIDQQAFFDSLTSAYVKMTSANVLTGDQGQIRTNCHFVNS